MSMLAINHLTPVVGIDVHEVIEPPAVPIFLPHPHVGFVLDLREYANAALAVIGSIVFTFVEEQVEEFAEKHAEDIQRVMDSKLVKDGVGAVNAVMNNDAVRAGQHALAKLSKATQAVNDALGATVGAGAGGKNPVFINGMLRATAGTHTFHVPGLHFPEGIAFTGTDALGPSSDAESFMGSRTVLVNGDPLSFLGLPALSCWCAGMEPMDHASAHTKRTYPSLPTSTMLPIPADKPVYVGGPPVMNMLAAAVALFKAFRGSALAKKLFKHFPSGVFKCKIMDAEPVNSITGEVVVQQNDFTVEGRLPLVWDRYYASHDRFQGVLGYGWRCPADTRLELVREDRQFAAAVHFHDHATAFDELSYETGWQGRTYDRQHGHALYLEEDEARIRTRAGIEYTFLLPQGWRDKVPSLSGGTTLTLALARVADLNGNAWHIERHGSSPDPRPALRLVEHAGDKPTGREVHAMQGSVAGCLGAMYLRDASGGTHPLTKYQQGLGGDLVTVFDAHDNPYGFEYAAGHLMVRHTDRNGLSFYYRHVHHDDGVWRVEHAWGDGGLYDYHFTYDTPHLETRFVDSLGHTTVLQYNDRQWPVARVNPLGGVSSYEYDSQGRTIAEVDPAGILGIVLL